MKKELIVKVYDIDTNKQISQNSVILTYFDKKMVTKKIDSSNTGIVIFKDIPYFENNFTIKASSPEYFSETKHFYKQQSEYKMPLKHKLVIKVYDIDTNKPIANVNIVSNNYQTTTNNAGKAVLNIVVNDKKNIDITIKADLYLEKHIIIKDVKQDHKVYIKQIGYQTVLKTRTKNKTKNGVEVLEPYGKLESTKVAYQYNLNKPKQLKQLYMKEFDGDYELNQPRYIQIVLVTENSQIINVKPLLIPSGDEVDKEHYVDLSKYKSKIKSIIIKPINDKGEIENLNGEWQIKRLSVKYVK